MVKRLSTMQETWVPSLGWEDLLEKEMAAHSSTLAQKNPMDGGAWQATAHGVAKSWTQLSDFTFLLSRRNTRALSLTQTHTNTFCIMKTARKQPAASYSHQNPPVGTRISEFQLQELRKYISVVQAHSMYRIFVMQPKSTNTLNIL